MLSQIHVYIFFAVHVSNEVMGVPDVFFLLKYKKIKKSGHIFIFVHTYPHTQSGQRPK